MYRFALLPLLAVVAFGQQSAAPATETSAEKAPPEVEQALRTRVSEFYELMRQGNTNPSAYRKGESYVAEGTKDYYYAGGKPQVDSFEVDSVQFSQNFTHAKVMTKCSQKVSIANFPPMQMVVNVPSLWMIEDGKWMLYEDPDKIGNPAGLKTKVEEENQRARERLSGQKPPVQTPSGADPLGALQDLPKDPSFVLGKVKADRLEVAIAPDSTEKVTISNESKGVMLLNTGYPLNGIEFQLDRKDVPPGGKAVLTLKAGKTPASGPYYLEVMPTREVIAIKV